MTLPAFKPPAVRLPYSKSAPARWRRFAEQIVSAAGVLDEETSELLTQAFATVPRDLFVLDRFQSRAHEDVSLPIEFAQNTSRPSVVARMFALIGLRRGMKVLEIGCGSGYASAVMTAAGANVFSVERLGFLAQHTRKLLDSLYLQNVIIHRGDGRRGWAEHAPYDAIIVSTPFENIDRELISQLVPTGGRMVAPVGDCKGQVLTLWETRNGDATRYPLESCNFSAV